LFFSPAAPLSSNEKKDVFIDYNFVSHPVKTNNRPEDAPTDCLLLKLPRGNQT
jgi:hypothetical protein